MASFQIHDDQENSLPDSNILHKETSEATKNQRRALGGINPNNHQQRVLKSKLQSNDVNIRNNENRARAVNKRDKVLPSSQSSVIPPVAQFEAFSVYEDKSEEQKNIPKEPVKIHVKKAEKHVPSSVLNLHTQRHPLQEKIKDVIKPDTPMSVGLDSSLCPMSISRSNTKEPEEEKKATAKTVRELFFHVAEYREDIYKYMRDIEWKHRPKAGYMRKQPDISHSMRAILVDWLVEVGEEYRLQTETLYLAVSYIDRFLSYMSVVRAKLQLVGTAAMFIASKYEEIYPPDLGEFVYITDDTYTKQQVLRMEHLILKVLSFDLSTPTPLAFISHFCIANGLSQKTLYLAMYISEMALLEAEPYLHFPSSILAASSLLVARHALLCCHCEGGAATASPSELGGHELACEAAAWPESLRKSSGYSPAQLERCVRHLERTHSAAPSLAQRAIPDKYKSSKYEGVSHIEAKPMYPIEPLIDEKSNSFTKKLNDSDLSQSNNNSSSNQMKTNLNESGKTTLKES